ncbi:hypothetical protein F4703DRAFT_1851939 [Phycomyces blakesleeanus]|uniref:Dilute domain-containing protein n=1 Tax=Phycomyces blakesleeanus (strain ATCC 8743b / DSM 1359 / FGSC 10004 / NBRC 33097 / NRRL 1555) TaxID=763407 RepID=A0A162UD33_PHYB8|nr:hypothetical protein PHYBLDRAFT_143607 [Phycomyces blakesleeanus NRRL 1555(-)]OAD75352.1 hypothetical protein PHYBLDRAFT_143607 [Phycomyces blakesleeanus NRRL 1555(-)]|eukprot:XP_018293392.1 hypothetical protein PHYBLDRAFT_143607 [Phycomyces blakesleeanus NRRL 1555(-)]
MMGSTSIALPLDTDPALDLMHQKPKSPISDSANILSIIKEQANEDEDPEKNRVAYENMSCDEMAKRMADSYRQLSEMLGTTIATPSTVSEKSDTRDYDFPELTDEETEEGILSDPAEEAAKKLKMTKLFTKAASNGNADKVRKLLQDDKTKALIDIDAKDEDGTTPLIYAVCFGKAEIAQLLLAAGAKIDIQDAFGWSALMWATNNNHEGLVKILLEHGASSQTKSAKGRTVFDFLNTENQKIVEILTTNPRDSISSTSSIAGRTPGSVSSTSSNAGDCDFYYQSTVEGYDTFMEEEANRHQKLIETAMTLVGGNDVDKYKNNKGYHDFENDEDDDDDDDEDFEFNEDDDENYEDNEFHWDRCMPDQMFVFAADDLDYILDTVITNFQLPVKTKQEICVPANVAFLSARFAHYFSSDELLHQVLKGALDRMSKAVKANSRNVHVLAFWITNFTQALYYLKKDCGLVVATAEHQLRLSELVLETYLMIINDTERRLAKVIVPAMLEHEQIPGMEDVDFADDWQRFFRRTSRRSVGVPPDGGLAVQMKRNTTPDEAGHNISPQSITSLLDSILFVFDSYNVHPTIIIQALAQFFHYMSCEMFNRILTTKKLLCRSKAMQIRLNLSQLEDWIRAKQLPSSLASYLNPTIQLLQLLQCLTQLGDLPNFISTVQTFDVVNSLQIKRCLINYRYEVNEARLPEDVERYAIQVAEDSIRYKQARRQSRQSMDANRKSGIPLSRAQSVSLQRKPSRRDSVSSFVGSLMSSVGISSSISLPPTPTTTEYNIPLSAKTPADSNSKEKEKEEEEEEGEEEDTKEIKDSRFMLPFSVPTTAHMVAVHSWASEPEEARRDKELQAVPVIPEEWMDKLDKGSLD